MSDDFAAISRPTGLTTNLQPLQFPESPSTPTASQSSSSSSTSLSRPSLNLQRPLSMGGATPPVGHSPRDSGRQTPKDLNVGLLKFPGDENEYPFNSQNLVEHCQIGRGNYGTVHKMVHRESARVMAVKRIRSNTVNKREQKRLIVELKTVMSAQPCEYIIRFYGALFSEGDCWICMELMDISLDKLYKKSFELGIPLSEAFVGHITVCTVSALSFLKDKLNIIHRDVKPSNIVMDQHGAVKLVDFGIAGQLVDSIAKTEDVGCKPYMAPERVAEMVGHHTYDVRSDVWSLGITLVEISTGRFPYSDWASPFHQLAEVVDGPAPVLTQDKLPSDYTVSYILFVNLCLAKEQNSRPKYHDLENHSFYQKYRLMIDDQETLRNFGDFVTHIIDEIKKDGPMSSFSR